MLAQLLCPTTPDAVVVDVSPASTVGTSEWNTMSSSAGHALSSRCLFGFQPSMNVGARSGSSAAGLSTAASSQKGASKVTEFSIGIALISLKLKRKLLYPPARNSPGPRVTSPKVTLGPTASMSRVSSEHGTGLCPPSDMSAAVGKSCAPQHMNTNRDGSAISVAPVASSVTTVRENSNATVTPRRFTDPVGFLCVTTSETYISLAAAAPPVMAASTAPTRTRSSEGSDDHVVTENLRSPDARSGQPEMSVPCCSERRRCWGSSLSLRGRVRDAGSIGDVECAVGCDHAMGSGASSSRLARMRSSERRIARAKRRWTPPSRERSTRGKEASAREFPSPADGSSPPARRASTKVAAPGSIDSTTSGCAASARIASAAAAMRLNRVMVVAPPVSGFRTAVGRKKQRRVQARAISMRARPGVAVNNRRPLARMVNR